MLPNRAKSEERRLDCILFNPTGQSFSPACIGYGLISILRGKSNPLHFHHYGLVAHES